MPSPTLFSTLSAHSGRARRTWRDTISLEDLQRKATRHLGRLPTDEHGDGSPQESACPASQLAHCLSPSCALGTATCATCSLTGPTGEDLADITRPRTLSKGWLHKRRRRTAGKAKASKAGFAREAHGRVCSWRTKRRERANATDGKRPKRAMVTERSTRKTPKRGVKGKEEEGTPKKVGHRDSTQAKEKHALS